MNSDSAKVRQNELKSAYDSCCDTLEIFSKNIKDAAIAAELERKMEDLFFNLECSAADSHSLYDTDDHEIGKWFADTCLDSMKALVAYVDLMKSIGCERYFMPSEKSLSSMQSLVRTFLEKKQVIELMELLSHHSITTIGLNEKRKFRMTKSVEKILSYACSFAFIVVVIVSAFVIPNPTNYQYTIFRITLALSGGGLAAFFTGFLTVEWPGRVKAGNGFAVFMIIYYLAPVAL